MTRRLNDDVCSYTDVAADARLRRCVLLQEAQVYMLLLSEERCLPRFERQRLRELSDKIAYELGKLA